MIQGFLGIGPMEILVILIIGGLILAIVLRATLAGTGKSGASYPSLEEEVRYLRRENQRLRDELESLRPREPSEGIMRKD